MTKIALPEVVPSSASSSLDQLTQVLGVPRDALPDDEMIANAWQQLPRLLNAIPEEYRTEHHLRMCVAVANGLFDAAINYIWNATVLRLRDRVRNFGVHLVPQVIGKAFEEKDLLGLKDSELTDLCRRLNLISEDAFFFLDQCRQVRNNFSTAHPAMGELDDLEVIAFLNRCTKYAMSDSSDPKGLDISALISAMRAGRFGDEQRAEWVGRLMDTHDVQRETAVGTLHGIYCDPSSDEEVRVNALSVCKDLAVEFTVGTKSLLINRHSDYIAEGKDDRRQASNRFFQELGLLGLLGEREQHHIFSQAAAQLQSVHDAYDNFHNEPPFARRLLALSHQTRVPATAQKEFVETIVMCAIGNLYGVSRRAEPVYHELIRGFSPQETAYMLAAPQARGTIIQRRIRQSAECRGRFVALVAMLDRSTVPPTAMADYERWLRAGESS